ncbi:atlastin-3-like isoform X2 [Chironomus tepperi]|uniref:atlastin-3-like isoform X2 n=1 Tax=Chironomus tepperi TaxID=113505 RepID=UPI00391F381F
MNSHKLGEPITVLKFNDLQQVTTYNDNLKRIFGHPDIQDRKVVILSLIGAFRAGKSFFLDYCLRFLYAHFPSIKNRKKITRLIFQKNSNWMGEPDEPLTGFSWRSGIERDTTGIIFWNDVFLHTIDRTGEEIAIFVMDTQGLFDNDSTAESNSKLFALGTLIPSIQILNIKGIIQENQLEYLQFATEYALNSTMDILDGKSFQSLLFLLRDWDNKDEYEYGMDGGCRYLDKILQPRHNESSSLSSVRRSIKNSFERTQCCLLPYPGRIVASTSTYNGCLSAMDDEFRTELKSVIESILCPSNMIIKRINSYDVNVKDMLNHILKYFEIFQSNSTMRVLNIYDSTVELYMNSIIDKCLNDYKVRMIENEDLQNISKSKVHEKCKAYALDMYDNERKMGSAEYETCCKAILSTKIDKTFHEFDHTIERERQHYQAIVEKEEKSKKELEKIIKKIIIMLETLKSNPDADGYAELKDILEARLDTTIKKLKDMEDQIISRREFRNKLRLIVVASCVAGAIGWYSNDIQLPARLTKFIDNVKHVLPFNVKPINIVNNAGSKITAETVTVVEKATEVAASSWPVGLCIGVAVAVGVAVGVAYNVPPDEVIKKETRLTPTSLCDLD